MGKKEVKTNAMRILDRMKIPYKYEEYECDEFTDGIQVADKLGYDYKYVYKTLVTTGKSGEHYVFVIPIEEEIDFKKASKVVGEKSLEMLHLKDLTKVTGYVRGGCTAVGMKKQYKTVIQESAKELDHMHVSGGKLGMQLTLAPLDLQKASEAEFADVIQTHADIDYADMDAVIFDIGNVLIHFAWEDYLHSFGFSEELYDRIADATFRNEDWDAGDSGLVTTEEWLNLFIDNAPDLREDICRVFEGFGAAIVPFSFTEDWIQMFRDRGMRVFYLSNYSDEMYRQSKERLSFLEGFDGGVFSWQEKCMKPDEKIYKILLERYHITPKRAVFFDDRPENVEAARRAGINGVVFTTDIPLQMLSK